LALEKKPLRAHNGKKSKKYRYTKRYRNDKYTNGDTQHPNSRNVPVKRLLSASNRPKISRTINTKMGREGREGEGSGSSL